MNEQESNCRLLHRHQSLTHLFFFHFPEAHSMFLNSEPCHDSLLWLFHVLGVHFFLHGYLFWNFFGGVSMVLCYVTPVLALVHCQNPKNGSHDLLAWLSNKMT